MNAIFQSFFKRFFMQKLFTCKSHNLVSIICSLLVGIDCDRQIESCIFLNEKHILLASSPQNAENRILGLWNFKIFLGRTCPDPLSPLEKGTNGPMLIQTVFEIQTRDICTLPPWRPHYRKVLLMISSTELKVRTTFPDSINVGTWKWKKKTTRQHTLRSQYDFVDAKDTETGKKSPGCPEMLNSMLPLLLDESMTGSCHSRIECLWS